MLPTTNTSAPSAPHTSVPDLGGYGLDPRDLLYQEGNKIPTPVPSFLDCFILGLLPSFSKVKLLAKDFGYDFRHQVSFEQNYRKELLYEDYSVLGALDAPWAVDLQDSEEDLQKLFIREDSLSDLEDVHLESALDDITMSNAKLSGDIAEFIGSAFNPINIASFGLFDLPVSMIGKGISKLAGDWLKSTFNKHALELVGFTSKGASEVALFSGLNTATDDYLFQLPTQSIGDSMLAGALYGSLLGASVGGSKLAFDAVRSKNYANELNRQVCNPLDLFHFELSEPDVGQVTIAKTQAAKSTMLLHQDKPPLADLHVVNSDGSIKSKVSDFMSKILYMSPNMKALSSKFPELRKLGELYFSNKFESSEFGIFTSVEDDLRQLALPSKARFINSYYKHLDKYEAAFNLHSGNSNLSKKQIEKKFRNDINNADYEGGSSVNPIINGIVNEMRDIRRKFRDDAIKFGLLDKDAVYRDDYRPQIYNKAEIRKSPQLFKDNLIKGFREREQEDFDRELIQITSGISDAKTNILNGINISQSKLDLKNFENQFKKLSSKIISKNQNYWNEVADNVIYTILSDDGVVPIRFDGSSMPNRFRDRVIKIKQEYLLPFMDNDPVKGMLNYIDNVSFKIAEKRAFSRFGIDDLDSYIDSFIKKQRLDASSGDSLKAIKLMREIPQVVSGAYSAKLRNNMMKAPGGSSALIGLDILHNLNMSTLLGSLGFSALEDLAANVMNSNLLKHLKLIFSKSYKQEVFSLSKEEANSLGFALDRILGSIRLLDQDRFNPYEDVEGSFNKVLSKVRDSTASLSDLTVKLSGIRFIDDTRALASASFHAFEIASDILDGKPKVGKLSGNALANIKNELTKFSNLIPQPDNPSALNTNLWNRDARSDFNTELHRRVGQEIIRPSKGDIPLFLRKPYTKAFSIFFSYANALTNQILIPMWKDGHFGQLSKYLVSGLGFSFFRSMLDVAITNTDLTNDDSLSFLGLNVIRRFPAGIFGLPLELVYQAANGSMNLQDVNHLCYSLLSQGSLKYALDLYNNLQKSIAKDSFDEKDLRRWVKCISLSNLPYVKAILNYGIYPNFN